MSITQVGPPRHRLVLELLEPAGRRLHATVLDRPDFARAVEATYFEALRRGVVRHYDPPFDAARVSPVFPLEGPESAGFEVVLPTPAGETRKRFGLDFFRTFARRASAQLVTSGQLDADATVIYRLTAYRDEPEATRENGLAFELESETSVVPIREGSRKALGISEAWDGLHPEDFPVLIHRHVLEDAVAEARQAPQREVGGVLLGHLCRDTDGPELFLEITALVPCEQTEATEVSVTFTHQTWARVREVVDYRGEGELIVGWAHSHPFRLCAECPRPVPAECQRKVLFYSADDEFLMELTFPRPFMVGLLAAVEPRLEEALGHLPVKLFGWKDGRIAPRGFEVIGG